MWCRWVKQITLFHLNCMFTTTIIEPCDLYIRHNAPCRNGTVYTPFIVCFTHSDTYINGIYLPECHISQRLNFHAGIGFEI